MAVSMRNDAGIYPPSYPSPHPRGEGTPPLDAELLAGATHYRRAVRLAVAAELAGLAEALQTDAQGMLAACGVEPAERDEAAVRFDTVRALARRAFRRGVPAPTLATLAGRPRAGRRLKAEAG